MSAHCSRCKGTENLPPRPYTTYVNPRTGKRYQYYMCNPCNAARQRTYRATEQGGARYYEAILRTNAKYPERLRARQKVRYALSVGHLVKPQVCESCQEEKHVDGHHPDYNLPLEVQWLCRQCHAALHRTLHANERLDEQSRLIQTA